MFNTGSSNGLHGCTATHTNIYTGAAVLQVLQPTLWFRHCRCLSVPLHASSSVNIIPFQVCSLERFHSLQEKLLLLEEAVAGHDGNVITAVSLAVILTWGRFLDGEADFVKSASLSPQNVLA